MYRGTEVLRQAQQAVVGKDDILVKTLLAILAGGHILIEDVPGVGKTTMALAFSRALGLEYNRVQFTPDVLPSDLTGYSIPDRATGALVYQPGALMCSLFLADELNRATSRTQSALLEAMEEGQVTVDGVSHPISDPFVVIATQNPTGAAGTQLLPDSQMDRFMVRLSMGYPDHENEVDMLRRRQKGEGLGTVAQVMSKEELCALRREVEGVYISDDMLDYLVRLIAATRTHPQISRGASPRASLALAAMSRAVAWMAGRDYVLPQDAQAIFTDTVAHRLLLTPEGVQTGGAAILEALLHSIPAPKIK